MRRKAQGALARERLQEFSSVVQGHSSFARTFDRNQIDSRMPEVSPITWRNFNGPSLYTISLYWVNSAPIPVFACATLDIWDQGSNIAGNWCAV